VFSELRASAKLRTNGVYIADSSCVALSAQLADTTSSLFVVLSGHVLAAVSVIRCDLI
jgi:hypothetical protein